MARRSLVLWFSRATSRAEPCFPATSPARRPEGRSSWRNYHSVTTDSPAAMKRLYFQREQRVSYALRISASHRRRPLRQWVSPRVGALQRAHRRVTFCILVGQRHLPPNTSPKRKRVSEYVTANTLACASGLYIAVVTSKWRCPTKKRSISSESRRFSEAPCSLGSATARRYEISSD